MSGRRLTNCRPDHCTLYLTFLLGTSWLCAHRLYVHSLFSAVHCFRIGIPFSHIQLSLCNPPPSYAQAGSGRGWYLFSSYHQIISGQKVPNTRLEVRTREWRLPHDCAVLLNGGKESLVPLLCNCVLRNTDRSRRQFLSTSCVLIQAECPVISHAVLVSTYCPVLVHMQF
jgi:hypothetical protein